MLPTAFAWIPVRMVVPPRAGAARGAERQPGVARPAIISDRPRPIGPVLVRRAVRDVAIAAVATLSAFALLEVATPAGASTASYATGSAAIAIATLWAGIRAGLIATALTAAVAAFLYLDPAGALAVADPGDRIGLGLFAVNGLILTALCGWLRSRSSRERSSSDARPTALVPTQPSLKPATAAPRATNRSGDHRGPAIMEVDGRLIERLTVREFEVLELLAGGLSNTEIADALVVSMNTVKSHLKSIFGKLGVVSRTQAVVRAGELGLLARQNRHTGQAA